MQLRISHAGSFTTVLDVSTPADPGASLTRIQIEVELTGTPTFRPADPERWTLTLDGVVLPAAPEQPSMDLRVQRLDPPVHDFREAGLLRHVDGVDSGLPKLSGGAAGGEYFCAECREALDEWDQVALVRDTDERASDFEH